MKNKIKNEKCNDPASQRSFGRVLTSFSLSRQNVQKRKQSISILDGERDIPHP
jgi:hypothetical protein